MPHVVTCLLTHQHQLLLLKRSNNVRTYKGLWGGVAGYIETNEQPYQTAQKEIKEETHLTPEDISLITQGQTISFTDTYEGKQYDWTIHPFVFNVEKKDKVQIDWEHSQYKWIHPREIKHYQTVPYFKEIVHQYLH